MEAGDVVLVKRPPETEPDGCGCTPRERWGDVEEFHATVVKPEVQGVGFCTRCGNSVTVDGVAIEHQGLPMIARFDQLEMVARTVNN